MVQIATSLNEFVVRTPPLAPTARKTSCRGRIRPYRLDTMNLDCDHWTTKELMAHRRCSAKAIKTLRDQCGLPFEALPKGFRYPKQLVLAWEANRVQVTRPTPPKPRTGAGSGPSVSNRRTQFRQPRTFGPRPAAFSI